MRLSEIDLKHRVRASGDAYRRVATNQEALDKERKALGSDPILPKISGFAVANTSDESEVELDHRAAVAYLRAQQDTTIFARDKRIRAMRQDVEAERLRSKRSLRSTS